MVFLKWCTLLQLTERYLPEKKLPNSSDSWPERKGKPHTRSIQCCFFPPCPFPWDVPAHESSVRNGRGKFMTLYSSAAAAALEKKAAPSFGSGKCFAFSRKSLLHPPPHSKWEGVVRRLSTHVRGPKLLWVENPSRGDRAGKLATFPDWVEV